MVKLIALEKGYALGRIIEPGEKFGYDDKAWADEKNRPKWAVVDPASVFGGKGDHDGDGLVGGSLPADTDDGDAKPKRGASKKKAETVAAQTAEPFADAPAPTTVQGNGLQAAFGGVQPDWIDPASGVAGGVPANDKPVMADE